MLGAPRLCFAIDPPHQATPEQSDKATTKFLADGNKAFKAGKFADAEAAYEQAFALKKGYDIAGNLAMAEFAQGKMRDASEHLAFALRLFPVTGDPGQRDQMQKTFDQCRSSVGTVKVTVNVKGALVYVDGKSVGEAPLADPVFVDPGEHTVEAKKPEEYKDASKKVTAAKGGTVEAALMMEELPKPKVGKEVVIEVPGPRRTIVPGVVMGVLAVGAIGAGAGLFAVSKSKENQTYDLANNQIKTTGACLGKVVDKRCDQVKSLAQQSDTFHNAAIGAFIGGGVLAIGTLTYLLLPSPKVKKTVIQSGGLHLTPVVGASQGGMIVSGAF